ncbi:hypothetical protein [Natronococcus jeotgali]|uniref:Uncharacterized protein n=1 Tax=Natronococcus jeotgali DSM 18795 TaxID=1227498 RepID=L9XHS5_9EURY|nr:hypothetical protein [Natronococcus jeotgali]ELY61265.1 hypothetical protein C492_09525 [Natronococcus jeotgali DSM 18795]
MSDTPATDFNLSNESSAEEKVESLIEIVQQQSEKISEVEEELAENQEKLLEQLREKHVATVAVKRVLLEYGLSLEQVDEIIETIEEVDSKLGGENDV